MCTMVHTRVLGTMKITLRYTGIIGLISLFICCTKPSASELTFQAEELENEGRYKEAILILDEAIKTDPDYLGAYINKGADYSILGEVDLAIKNYKIVLNKDSKNELAMFNIGLNYVRINKERRAIDYFNKIVDTKSGQSDKVLIISTREYEPFKVSFEEVLFERGNALYTLGSYDSAFYDFKYCAENNYLKKESFYNMGCVYEVFNDKDSAVVYYQKAKNLGDLSAIEAINSLNSK